MALARVHAHGPSALMCMRISDYAVKRSAVGLSWWILVAGLGLTSRGAAADTVTHALTAEDYARAERFLQWNESRYVRNGDIKPHWVDGEDRLWYLRTSADGGKKFVVVDAINGRETPAFDQNAIADSISKRTGATVKAGNLPFSSFRYVQRQTSIQFQLAGIARPIAFDFPVR